MKILFISEFLVEVNGRITGGDEARTLNTAKYLVSLGHDVSILTSQLPGTKPLENVSGVVIYRVGPVRPYIQSGDLINRLITFPLAVFQQGLKLDFDVVDGNSVAAWPLARILGILKRKKVVYWVPDVLLEDWRGVLGRFTGFVAKAIEYSCALFPPDRIIALSQTTKGKLHSLGVRLGSVSVVYPGVLKIASKKTKLHRPVRLISVQRLVPYKRTDLVIIALSKVKNDIVYLIIGDGPEKEELRRLTINLGLDTRVKFLGNLTHPKVSETVRTCDLFILPSETEGFGIVTLEAMAQGLPFINSDIPVHGEIARASRAGLLFRSGDADDLARKITKFAFNQNLYQKLSQNAITFARKYTWEKVVDKTMAVYQSVLGNTAS